MKRAALLLVLMMLLSDIKIFAADNNIAEIYVAPFGSNENNGSFESPFATVEKAIEVALTNGVQTQIYLRGGEYKINNTVKIENNTVPIKIMAYKNEQPRFCGGVTISEAQMKTADEEVSKLLPTLRAKKNVKQVDLKDFGITQIPEFKNGGYSYAETVVPQVYQDNTNLISARYPNIIDEKDVYIKTGEVLDSGESTETLNQHILTEGRGAVFRYVDDRIENWHSTDDVFVYGYWKYDWAENNIKIKSVDKEQKTITLDGPTVYGVKGGKEYYYFNIIDELDQEGEYYIDKENLMLYFYPKKDFDMTINIPNCYADYFFEIYNASDITISGIEFCYTYKSFISISNSDNININNCKFNGCSSTAISAKNNTDLKVTGSDFQGIGYIGVDIAGGDRNTLTPCENYVSDCLFYNFSTVKKTYAPAVKAYGVGITVENCEMSYSPHTAILFEGNDIVIRNNEIYDVLRETNDCGAIYGGRDITAAGNIIEGNYIHDISSDGGDAKSAVYCDDCLGNPTILNNIFARIPAGITCYAQGIAQVSGNIFCDVYMPITVGTWGYGDDAQTFLSYSFCDPFSWVDTTSPVWEEKFPQVVRAREVKTVEDVNACYSFKFTDNKFVCENIKNNLTEDYSFSDILKSFAVIENNSVMASLDMDIHSKGLLNKRTLREEYRVSYEPVADAQIVFYGESNRQADNVNAENLGLHSEIEDIESWTDKTVKIDNSTLSRGADQNFIPLFLDKKIGNNILNFEINTEITNDKWLGLILRAEKNTGVSWGGNSSYLIVIKEDQIELQRWVGTSDILKVVKNEFLKSGENTIQLGAFNNGDGVNIILYANGKEVFNCCDNSYYKLNSEGYFGILNPNDITLKPSDEQLLDIPINLQVSGSGYIGEKLEVDYSILNYSQNDIEISWYNYNGRVRESFDDYRQVAEFDTSLIEKISGQDKSDYIVQDINTNKSVLAGITVGENVSYSNMIYVSDTKNQLKNNILMATEVENALVNGSVYRIDENNIYISPIILDNRLMLPLRFIAEKSGMQCVWNDETDTATVTSGDNNVVYKKNDNLIWFDRMFIDSENAQLLLGRSIDYDKQNGIIIIGNKIELNEADKDNIISYLQNN